MSDEIVIENLEGKNIKARVKDPSILYSSFRDFANEAGYSDAVGVDKKSKLENRLNETFSVLAKGNHPWDWEMLYLIQSQDGEKFIVGERGLELIEPKEINLEDMSYGEIKEHAEKVLEQLRLKAYREGYQQGKFDEEMDSISSEKGDRLIGVTQQKLVEVAQQTRDQIVEQAKTDIVNLKNNKFGNYYNVKRGLNTFSCDVEFIVNKEKRTVVALMKGISTGKIYAKGIAKAHPNDCFNVHIGMAIALNRALDMKVKEDYLNVPQPTEVRVGDIVESTSESFPFWGNGVVTRIEEPEKYSWQRGYYVEDGSYNFTHQVKIIDDSREEE